MKNLLFACASLMLISSAMAADGADVKINGEIRMRHAGSENAAFAENSWDNKTEQRTKLGFHFTKSEDLMAHVTLLTASTWGNAGTTNTSGELTAGDTDNDVNVYEAWVFWKAMDNFSVRLGRGALDIADGSVISKNDYEQRPWAFEGALGTYYHEMLNLNAFLVKGMNDDATNSADVNFYGLSADLKVAPEIFKMFNVHVLQSKATGLTAGAKDDKLRLGLTLAGDTNAIDYRGTYAMYTGEQTVSGTATDHKASMMDLEAGYTVKDMMNFRVHAIYHSDSGDSATGSGDKETYDPFFYESHENAGLMDLVGWGNSTYYKLGVALEPAEMLTVGLDYYMFMKTEENDSVYNSEGAVGGSAGGNNLTAIGTASGDDVGSEIDLWVKKTLSNGAETWFRYGMFQADDALGADAEDVSDFQVGATFRF